jgi:D-serine deaminase-like pyridoxal phosphate-dependent protein
VVQVCERPSRLEVLVNRGEFSTPALTVDLDTLERNVVRMAAYCREHGLGLRPHTKTHKTPEVARMQLEGGACGLTVAKVGEAEVMAAATNAEILVAFPIFGWENLRRLASLARVRNVLISLDGEDTAREVSRATVAQESAIGVLVEFDVGLRRCGLQSSAACVELATKVREMPRLQFRGVMFYSGNVWGGEEERKQITAEVSERVDSVLRAFTDARIPVGIVSGGSTPGAFLSHQMRGLTEVRPGTYVYNDLNTYYQGVCTLEDCAARVVTTVVSTAVPGRAMIDAGSKALSSDLLSSGPREGYGYVVEAPDAKLFKLNEEHGYLDTSASHHTFDVGEVLTVIPNHVCTCVNMHDEVFTIRNGEIAGSWRVAARGKIR